MSKEHRALLEATRDKARRASGEMLDIAITIARNTKAEDKDRIRALEVVLERGWGKAAQPVVGDADAPPVGDQMTSADQREALARILAIVRQPAPPSDGNANS